jgi:hypothetical protein
MPILSTGNHAEPIKTIRPVEHKPSAFMADLTDVLSTAPATGCFDYAFPGAKAKGICLQAGKIALAGAFGVVTQVLDEAAGTVRIWKKSLSTEALAKRVLAAQKARDARKARLAKAAEGK